MTEKPDVEALIERLWQATMMPDWGDLPDDAAIPAVPLLKEAAATLRAQQERIGELERENARIQASDEWHYRDRPIVEWVARAEAAEAKLAEADRVTDQIETVADSSHSDHEVVQYVLPRGLSAMGFNLPTPTTWDVMRAAIDASSPCAMPSGERPAPSSKGTPNE